MYGAGTFLARVADDAMSPRIAAGDHVYVDPDEPAVDGSMVLFGYGEEAVVRQLVVAGGWRVLRALRDGYPEITVDADNETGLRGVVRFAGRGVGR